ncbi:polysaccharide pyruvyl transferase family protein [Rhodobacter sp. NSM]|uniref:polysaccharide pyruvyl transferase family protein n=1 Tax=Rhodobacter sp. NSM TaxID=3457501 RepID=UPI003FD0ADF2
MRFSPNLGDGLLAECLEHRLVELGAGDGTRSIDLAARTGHGRALPARGALLAILAALPGPVRRVAIRAPLALLTWKSWRPHYRAGLEGADAVVIGGGNLLADLDLNFPTKLALALEEACRRNLPVAIHACGMSRGWSAAGLRMVGCALARTDLRAVFLRDEASCAAWNELLAPQAGRTAEVVRDPGLMASRVFPQPARLTGVRPVAGIGITSAVAIRYHSDRAPDEDRLERWFLDLARELAEAGHEVRAFTNGSPEDRACLNRVAPRLEALGGRILSPETPADLCSVIAGLDVLVAFRLHAIIAAHSFGVPTLGLCWDPKLDAFMASVERGDFLLDITSATPAEALRLMTRARQEGLPPGEPEGIVAEAAADVARLYAAFHP